MVAVASVSKKEEAKERKKGRDGISEERAMDREGGLATGMLCRLVRRTSLGFYSKSIRFEGYGGGIARYAYKL